MQQAVLRSQRDEETGALVYDFMARREKNVENKGILARMSADEKSHAGYWQGISGIGAAKLDKYGAEVLRALAAV